MIDRSTKGNPRNESRIQPEKISDEDLLNKTEQFAWLTINNLFGQNEKKYNLKLGKKFIIKCIM